MATELLIKTTDAKKRQFVGYDYPLPVTGGGTGAGAFGEITVAEKYPLIELNSAYGPTAQTDVETTTGSGAISASSTGEILLSTGATASSSARLDSAERLRYQPGSVAEIGCGIRIPTAPTSNLVARWGLREPGGDNGVYFGQDATGYFVAVKRGGTETLVRQDDWNGDKMDGTGASGITLDTSKGFIFQIDFAWYGYGPIDFEIVNKSLEGQPVILLHRFAPSEATSIQTPNLPIFVEADNGGDATDFDVYVGGRQAAIVGRYNPRFRRVGQERLSVSTTTTSKPLISFRNKTDFQDRSVRIEKYVAKVATQDHVIEFYLDPTLTGASWTTPTNATAAETALEVDVSATALSGGTLVDSDLAVSGQANKDQVTNALATLNIPENQIITMAARTVTGTGTVTTAFFKLNEEW